MKEKFLWIGIVLSFVCWAGNYLYAESQTLEQPIFLEHYYESKNSKEVHLEFFYLSNKKNPVRVTNVNIDENIRSYVDRSYNYNLMTNSNIPVVNEYIHQYLQSVYVRIPVESIPPEGFTFEEMEVWYSGASEPVTVNVGEVVLKGDYEQDRILNNQYSGSSNQNREAASFKVKESFTLNNISIPFSKIEDQVQIKLYIPDEEANQSLEDMKDDSPVPDWLKGGLNADWDTVRGTPLHEDMFPIKMNKGDTFTLFVYLDPDRLSYFDFGLKLEGITQEGKTFSTDMYIHDTPYLEEEDINQLHNAQKEDAL